MTQSPPPEYEHSQAPAGPPPSPADPAWPPGPPQPQSAPPQPPPPQSASPQFLPTQPLPAQSPQPIPLQPTTVQPIPLAPPMGPTPAARPSLNVFAIVAFITGICGGLLLSVIFAIVALVQIGRTGQRGKGFAVAALVISAFYLIVGTALVIVALANDAKRDPSGAVTKAGTISVDDLRVGDCVLHLDLQGGVRSVDVAPCAQSHESEVFAIFNVSGSEFPGQTQLQDQAKNGCQDRFDSYAPNADEFDLLYLMPTSQTWQRGDREVVCLAYHEGVVLTGSIRG